MRVHACVRAYGEGGQDKGQEKEGKKAYKGTKTRRDFEKKRVPAKIFQRKFCGLKIYPYVCSA